MNKNILGNISICKKASKLLVGSDVVFAGLEDNKVRLVLASNDCSPKTLKPIKSIAQSYGVVVMTTPFSKEELGVACGKSACAICGVTDIGLASSIGKKLAESSLQNQESSKVLDLKLKRKNERMERKLDPTQVRAKKTKVQYNKKQDEKQDDNKNTTKSND